MSMIPVDAPKIEDDGRVAVYEVQCTLWSGNLRYLYRDDQWQGQGRPIHPKLLQYIGDRLDQEAWSGSTLPADLSGYIEIRNSGD